jgi:glucokinase
MPETRQFVPRDEAKRPLFMGVDLGGTTIKLSVVDDEGRLLSWQSVPTDVQTGPEDAAARMGQAVRKAIDQVGVPPSAVAAVGLGSPGILDYQAGVMVNPTNFPGWGGFPIRDRVSHHCGLPVALANDASAAAYGEFWVGSGRSFRSLILLTLGTGVGCGIIIGDLIIEGENGHGTECGHILVEPAENARLCSCGQTGHLESYASAMGVIGRTRDAMGAGRATSLSKRLSAGEELTPLVVAEEAEAGDPLATEIVIETARYLGLGIVTLLHTIDPTGVLIGGAMTFGGSERELGRRFLARVREEVRRRAFPILAQRTIIDYATLGPDAGVIGAAGIARVEYFRALRKGGGSRAAAQETTATRSI